MTNFFNDEQKMFQETARRFAEKEIDPVANQIDQTDKIPESIVAKAKELNFFGLYIPEVYGGLGKSLTNACIVLEQIAKASPSVAGVLSVEIVLCPGAIDEIGSEEQKRKHLTASASGERLLAWSMTEPSGAANIPAHSTRLVKNGNGYKLNGSKLFTTQGNAQTIMVMAATEEGGEKGYGCAIVDIDAKGVDVGPHESKLGWRGTNTGGVSYSDVDVSPENILGNLLTGNGDLWYVNQASFIAHSVTSLGGAQGLLDKTIEFVNQRSLYNGPMSRLQPVSYWLAEAHASLEACRALIYNACRMWDEGPRNEIQGSICKAFVCDTAFQVSSRLLQLWGGSGIMDSTGVNRYFRDARTNMIAEASSEIHYDIISGAIQGIEPAFSGG
ncbi:acyl-CoA dehydrogenase family protein [Hyphomonas sp.]|uniref:acyl-CoA dehydrogenase family protein n=1 Tax=Hyphomonas sp. TaxID=87 RepID=UPI003F72E186